MSRGRCPSISHISFFNFHEFSFFFCLAKLYTIRIYGLDLMNLYNWLPHTKPLYIFIYYQVWSLVLHFIVLMKHWFLSCFLLISEFSFLDILSIDSYQKKIQYDNSMQCNAIQSYTKQENTAHHIACRTVGGLTLSCHSALSICRHHHDLDK